MKTDTPRVAERHAELVLRLVAEWLGPRMGFDGPAPTGRDAAYTASGPMLNMAWDWPSSGPAPTVLLEGGPYDWAADCCADVQQRLDTLGAPVYVEPYSGWALCIYPGGAS